MKEFYFVLIFFHKVNGKLSDFKTEKLNFCKNLQCDESVDHEVCGIRYEGEEVVFKLFDNECKLLQYGCQVNIDQAFGLIDTKYCSSEGTQSSENIEQVHSDNCPDCSAVSSDPACGLRQEGSGFRVRTFENICELKKHNCYYGFNFSVTDFFICASSLNKGVKKKVDNEILDEEEPKELPEENTKDKVIKSNNVIVVNGPMLDPRNVNKSINNFFASTHILDLPVKDMQPFFNESTRKRMIRIFGPVKVFRPWVVIPQNVSDDYYHLPTITSCYHKCPMKCPDTYAPVCGVPGLKAREPSLVFQNHCFMDVAQCKMFWEGKSVTSESSAYIESPFLFCLGDEMNGMYRFLPLVRTLQHMGRLPLKGRFKYKMRNMRFFNNFLSRNPRIMG